ncbi:hypothetical protein EZ313_08295 [Ramlibacter henchirensis]|uniref:Uncharacterized protein n=1 Tax=Ramlibacter henchirensis TaxID=204072 RepID=A0A4Z0C850_9BURK|nr:hypothetical protein [Ramlibacter henchirensis]TFZ06610.1 hypothetical protein EZ313_08295 [Ramlibacter henchirensis]
MTSPPDTGTGSDRPEGRQGNTTTAQGEDQRAVPRMPHERDESADSQPAAEPSHDRVGKKAQGDQERGVADTTKGAELDATYDKLREDMPDGEKKFRP